MSAYRIQAPAIVASLGSEWAYGSAARMLRTEAEAKERACEILAGYIGRWNLPTRCEWRVAEEPARIDSDPRALRRVELHVDGALVWRARWTEATPHVWMLVTCWRMEPWKIARKA